MTRSKKLHTGGAEIDSNGSRDLGSARMEIVEIWVPPKSRHLCIFLMGPIDMSLVVMCPQNHGSASFFLRSYLRVKESEGRSCISVHGGLRVRVLM
ncbi:hypothetical protein M378DRAFT_170472, partial [Amanita muscaria Koide BX008]